MKIVSNRSSAKTATSWLGLIVAAFGAAVLFSCGPPNYPVLPTAFLEAPNSHDPVHNAILISGWALSEDGISRISIYLDRHYLKDAKTHIMRPDVQAAFPKMPDASEAGWQIDLDLKNVTPGTHNVVVQVRSTKGATTDLPVSITVQP